MISIFAGDHDSAATHLQSALNIALAEKNQQLEVARPDWRKT